YPAEDGIRDFHVTGVQTCALPICEVITLIGRYKDVKYLKHAADKSGYRIVTLVKDGVRKTKTVHRLVTEAFMGESDLCVNHIDRSEERRVGEEWSRQYIRTTATRV